MSRLASRRGAVGAFNSFTRLCARGTAVEYASMRSARMSILAGTALALIMAAMPGAAAARLHHAGQHDQAADADHTGRRRPALPQHAPRCAQPVAAAKCRNSARG